ncbi:hypothetical protein [Bordetella sp. BOR01]|uniref:hypothetical protein n=1 Tax=Bordetella sp. BOR01 TaxID=2854779 RepID=UPI001C4679AF|nr:hypothetical protein [Bordetella sp. BOR01]MBV7482507.1 hypothetical protein [Bordetella sp. BOR01]
MTQASTVQCVGCRLFSLQKHAAMATQGFGRCDLDADHPGRFQSSTFQRFCSSFAAALAPVVEKRVVWLRQQQEERRMLCSSS